MAKSKKREVKEVSALNKIEDLKMEDRLYDTANSLELIAKKRDDRGIITGFQTNTAEIFTIKQIIDKMGEDIVVKAKNRHGEMQIVTVSSENELGIGEFNLGHLPDC